MDLYSQDDHLAAAQKKKPHPERKADNVARSRSSQQDRQRVRRNGAEPCQRCLDHSVDCEYADYMAPAKAIDAGNVEQLENRMASMERLFRQFLERFNDQSLGHTVGRKSAATDRAAGPTIVPSEETLIEHAEQDNVILEDDIRIDQSADLCLEDVARVESPPYCYADGFGELDTDTTGQLRYVGIGSTAAVVDTCVGLRRHIHEGLEMKGYEIEETFFASPEASSTEAVSTPAHYSPNYDIPPIALVKVLINTYIRDFHFLFPISPQEDIQSLYAKVLIEKGLDTGSAAIFYAVLAMSSLLVPSTHIVFSDIDTKYRQPDFGSSLYASSLHFINVSTNTLGVRKGKLQDIVVAMGLLSTYLAAVGSQAEAWIMVGRAIRQGQDLGLHRSPERLQLPSEERSRRRYIWWCLYVLERQLCTALGRPVSVDDADGDVEIPCEATDRNQIRETTGFVSLIHLHKIIGDILKTVNSVKNVDSWREVGKYEELRTRVRDFNMALQVWAKDHVPHEIRSATSGRLLIQKQVALSGFFSAVLLLYRIFMSNPHRPSPLADPQAQIRCAKAATDCIRGASDFLQHVPRSQYLVFHAQYVFVGAIVLLQFVRGSEDVAYRDTALKDIQVALTTLQTLEQSWNGARKCGAIVEEYLEFTYHILETGRKGICNFEHAHGESRHHTLTAARSKDIRKHRGTHAKPRPSGYETPSKRRKVSHPSHTQPSVHQNTTGLVSNAHPHQTNSLGLHSIKRRPHQEDKPQNSGLPREILRVPHTVDLLQVDDLDGTDYFDNVIDNGLGQIPIPQTRHLQPDEFSHGFHFDFDFNSADLSSLCPELWTHGDQTNF